MFLTKLALKRPVSVILFMITITFFGLTSLMNMRLAYQPEVDMPTFIVMTVYLGAEPEIIEKTITKDVENVGSLITGFTEVSSYSAEDRSTVVFMFDYDVDSDQTYTDLKTEIDKLIFPEDAMTPVIMQMAFDATAMMSISVTADEGEDAYTFANDIILPQIEAKVGVAEADIYGGQEDYVRITLDPTKMKQYGLTMSSISSAISLYDFELPVGSVYQGVQDISVSSSASLKSLADLQDVALTTSEGDLITLKEIADVRIGAKDATSLSRYGGRDNVSIELTGSQDANVPTVSADIRKTLEKISADNPGFIIDITYDERDAIMEVVVSLLQTILLGVFLCMFVLYIFFGDFRASLIVGSSIPMSLIVTLICMNACGFELNSITGTALIIAIGMMVDNSIVVLESIFKVREEDGGNSPLDQDTLFKGIAFRGTSMVAGSVLASTITTIVVYLPLVTMGGISGQMFVELSYTIVFAMTASLLAAIVIVPLFYYLLKPREKISLVTRILKKLERGYGRMVTKVLRRKFITVSLAIFMLFGSFGLLTQIEMVLLPSTDGGIVGFAIEFRPNSQLESMNAEMMILEQMLEDDPRIKGYQISISGNSGSINAYVADGYETMPLVQEYLEITAQMANMSISVTMAGDMAASISGDLNLITTKLHGYDYDKVRAAARAMQEDIYQISGVVKVESTEGGWGSAKAMIDIDPKKALDFGVNPLSVSQLLRQAVSGLEVLTIEVGLDEYDVFLEFPSGYADNLHNLMELPIDTQMGQIPVNQMATISFSDALETIQRVNGYYVIDLTVTPFTGTKSQVAAEIKILENIEYETEVYIGNGPGVDIMTDEMVALLVANGTAIFLVFMVMAMQFESVRFSLMVMTSVWFSFIGSFGLLYISGQPITIIAMMGVLMLMGIVVNNGILFVDTANDLQNNHGHSMVEALILSGRSRMRPIIMTTLTTILSMLPLAFGIGEGNKMMQSMGIIIIGGLVASTILVLFLMPTFYVLISKKQKKKKKGDQSPPPPPPPPEVKEEIPTLEVVVEDGTVPLSTVDVPKFPEKPEVIQVIEEEIVPVTAPVQSMSDPVKSLPEGEEKSQDESSSKEEEIEKQQEDENSENKEEKPIS